jgi:hypothetical protein
MWQISFTARFEVPLSKAHKSRLTITMDNKPSDVSGIFIEIDHCNVLEDKSLSKTLVKMLI